MHFVHYNSDKYSSDSDAQTNADGLAVLSVLIQVGGNCSNTLGYWFKILHPLLLYTIFGVFQEGEYNPAYENIINNLAYVQHTG